MTAAPGAAATATYAQYALRGRPRGPHGPSTAAPTLAHGEVDAAEPPDNDDRPPPPQTHLWRTFSLSETLADLKKGLAMLPSTSTTSTSTEAPPMELAAAVTARGPARTLTPSSSSTHTDGDVMDDLSRGPLASPFEDVDAGLFRKAPSRFAPPAQPSPLGAPAAATTPSHAEPRAPDGDKDKRRNGGQATSLSGSASSSRRLVQLTGPGIHYQTVPAGSVSWSVDGVVRSHGGGVGAPVGPHGVSTPWGTPWGTINMTGVVGQRGSVAGTLAGSLHGGVNVLLGGAMLSGLILLVFFICYCCQRSARKSDAHFRTQYWLPDPDGPLEVFTLDAQNQRLDHAGAVLLPTEPLDALAASPSPPPAYHTVVNLPPLSKPADGGGPRSPDAPSPSSAPLLLGDGGVLAKDACLVAVGLARGFTDLDADGLPSYEAALKLESQGHI